MTGPGPGGPLRQTLEVMDRNVGSTHCYRTITLDADGKLTLASEDLGPDVESFWGNGFDEYEWETDLDAAGVRRLREVLGLDPMVPLLEAFAQLMGEHDDFVNHLEQVIREHGIPSEFWSRLGR